MDLIFLNQKCFEDSLNLSIPGFLWNKIKNFAPPPLLFFYFSRSSNFHNSLKTSNSRELRTLEGHENNLRARAHFKPENNPYLSKSLHGLSLFDEEEEKKWEVEKYGSGQTEIGFFYSSARPHARSTRNFLFRQVFSLRLFVILPSRRLRRRFRASCRKTFDNNLIFQSAGFHLFPAEDTGLISGLVRIRFSAHRPRLFHFLKYVPPAS